MRDGLLTRGKGHRAPSGSPRINDHAVQVAAQVRRAAPQHKDTPRAGWLRRGGSLLSSARRRPSAWLAGADPPKLLLVDTEMSRGAHMTHCCVAPVTRP
jgi:hypothetical protein